MNDTVLTTLLLYGAPLPLLCGAIHLGLWLTDRQQKAYLFWSCSNLIGISAFTLLLMRGIIPFWISAVVANTLFVASGLSLWAGLRCFAGQPIRAAAFCTLLGAFALAYSAFALAAEQGLGPRILLISLVFMLMNLGMAFDLHLHQKQHYSAMRSVLIVVMLIHALFYLYRGYRGLLLDPTSDLLRTVGQLDLTTVAAILKTGAWNLCVVLMVREAQGRLPGPATFRSRNPSAAKQSEAGSANNS